MNEENEEKMVGAFVKEFYGMRVPPHMHEGLLAYVIERCPPGGFLWAVLSNDLQGAVGRADDENIRNIPAIVNWLYNEAPAACWGGHAQVARWLGAKEAGS